MNCLTYNDEFIKWFHEFSVTTNVRIFRKNEFVYLFLCTVNVNNNNHFRRKNSSSQNWWNYLMNSLVTFFMPEFEFQNQGWFTRQSWRSIDRPGFGRVLWWFVEPGHNWSSYTLRPQFLGLCQRGKYYYTIITNSSDGFTKFL